MKQKPLSEMTMVEMLAEISQYKDFQWPQWVQAIFPAVFIYRRKNKPKPRRGFRGALDKNSKQFKAYQAEPTKENGRKIPHKYSINSKAKDMNNYWVYTTTLLSPDGMGTIRRNFKHKGYGELCAICFAMPEEIEQAKNNWRYMVTKYKSFIELYNLRRVSPDREAEWLDMCTCLEKDYPTKATGQLRLL